MSRLNRTAAILFAGAASVCLGLMQTPARASDDLTLMPAATGRPLYFDEAAPAAPAPPPPKPLAGELDKLGVKTGPFAIYGYVEGSYTASFNPPPGNVLTGRVFEIADNESVLLNQADLTIEDCRCCRRCQDGKFDIGGRVEMLRRRLAAHPLQRRTSTAALAAGQPGEPVRSGAGVCDLAIPVALG